MRSLLGCALMLSMTFLGSGCFSYLSTKAVSSPDAPPRGLRVYAARQYLLVDTGEKKSQLVTLADPCRAYDVRPITVLSKQDFNIKLEEGRLKDLTANQDSTAWLQFLKSVGELAAKAAGTAVSASQINGTFGLKSGVYLLHDGGGLEHLTPGKDKIGACGS